MSNTEPNIDQKNLQAQPPSPNLMNDIPKQGLGWIPMAFAIATLIPTSLWMFPDIIWSKWLPDRDYLMKISIGIALIALGLKLNTWLKNKSESTWDSKSNIEIGGSGGGSSNKNANLSTQIQDPFQSKPLTKSYSMMNQVGGKGKFKEVGHYRHEEKLQNDGMMMSDKIGSWGGTDGASGGATDSAGRSIQKKQVTR